MCLIAQGNRKKTKENIICYKMLKEITDTNGNKILVSPFHYSLQWNLNSPYTETKKATFYFKGNISSGYIHSYKNVTSAIASFKYRKENLKLFECIIPKNTYYYYGAHPMLCYGFASKTLIPIKEIIVLDWENMKWEYKK